MPRSGFSAFSTDFQEKSDGLIYWFAQLRQRHQPHPSSRTANEDSWPTTQGSQDMNRGYLTGAALAVALVSSGTAHARDLASLLTGTFSSSGTQICLESPGGFNADLAPNATGFTTTTSTLATMVFNGDGAGSATAQQVSVAAPPAASGAAHTLSVDFIYTVGTDRTVSTLVRAF
jgi:hypothetical protein